jgi:glutamate mutase epsilon subunit
VIGRLSVEVPSSNTNKNVVPLIDKIYRMMNGDIPRAMLRDSD